MRRAEEILRTKERAIDIVKEGLQDDKRLLQLRRDQMLRERYNIPHCRLTVLLWVMLISYQHGGIHHTSSAITCLSAGCKSLKSLLVQVSLDFPGIALLLNPHWTQIISLLLGMGCLIERADCLLLYLDPLELHVRGKSSW